jgi:hypothetical protein
VSAGVDGTALAAGGSGELALGVQAVIFSTTTSVQISLGMLNMDERGKM